MVMVVSGFDDLTARGVVAFIHVFHGSILSGNFLKFSGEL